MGAKMTDALLSLALLLAQTCVAEIGFRDTTDECKLMWQINYDNAGRHRRSVSQQTKLFNGYWGESLQSQRQRAARPWIAHLRDDRQPRHWQRNLSWPAHRERWLRYLEAAKAFVGHGGAARHPCPGAMDYGAPGEIPKGPLVRIECLGGDTEQHYWRRR